jgi:hypothetical protein
MAILATQRVLTLDFWKLANDIVPGDYLFDRTGSPVKVTLVQKYMAQACYEVTMHDWLGVSGDGHMRMPIETRPRRNKTMSYKGKLKFRSAFKYYNMEELSELPIRDKRSRYSFSVPTTDPIQLPYQTLPVPPFLFGYWFFAKLHDQSMCPQVEYEDFVHKKFRDHGYQVTIGQKNTKGRHQFYTNPTVLSHLIPLVPQKIPNNYLWASVEQRLELLSGIMCAKRGQYNQKRDLFRFSFTNINEVTQVQALAESLGCRTKVQFDPHRKTYTVFIKTRLRLVPNQDSPPIKVHQARRYVHKVTPIPAQMCVHIETTGEDNTILVGEGFISVC